MEIEAKVGQTLRRKKMTIAVAESCTGGFISNRITDISGSSHYFKMGLVAYSNKIKENILWIPGSIIDKYGAVSKQVALEMAEGVRAIADTDIGLGVTGIAGPTGGTKSKPVGMVYIALVSNKRRVERKFLFRGSRQDIKSQASQMALDLILKTLSPKH